jgi:hypothetical protein
MVRVLRFVGAGVAVGALSCGAVSSSASASLGGGGRVGPNQVFAGLVNGKFADARVLVVCPGPAGGTGRALAHQTLEVTRAVPTPVGAGFTGAKATSIVAQVGPATATAGTVRFTRYLVKMQFPTNVPVPCGGTGIVTFTPEPGSPTARLATVTVDYANIAATG